MKINKNDRIGTVVKNISGYTMKCIAYRNSMDIDVEFLDGSCCIVKNVQWNNFIRGKVKNKTSKIFKCDISIVDKNGKIIKEYYTWHHMIERCFDTKIKNQKPTYKNAECCEEWLCFSNFYEWLHNQENFKIWNNLKWSAIDKDILIKGNKIYSPETCCLVPVNVNNLFVKYDALRGECPIGVYAKGNKFEARYTNPLAGKREVIGLYNSKKEAFVAYKKCKEALIKKVADVEYKKGTITKKCRDAMYLYEVDIND